MRRKAVHHAYSVIINAYADGQKTQEGITSELVYYGSSERIAGYAFYRATREAMKNSLVFSVVMWRDQEVIARAVIEH